MAHGRDRTSTFCTRRRRRTSGCRSRAATVGCCTSCAVRIKSGQIRQPEALGISAELKDKGYALLCVGFPSGDVEVETQDEDEAST
ncbi:Ferredoxin-2 [Zea mays]|uniref:Ferredoxin-2 n=1 Tax=Zea mays TaxID=4577 RepID=A0A3L6EIH2_MAIZE|nr:Ferredoxin-2 [Zea mays]